MKMQQLLDSEKAVSDAYNACRRLATSEEFDKALSNATVILAEVRHFAWLMEDLAHAVAIGDMDEHQAKEHRQRYAERLITFCTPEESK